jgi:hypothetical protein
VGELIDREKRSDRQRAPVTGHGEQKSEASRQRDLREYTEAINKGYRNSNITGRMKK